MSLLVYLEVLMIDPVELRFGAWRDLGGGWGEVQRMLLVHQLCLQLLRVLLRQRQVSILVVQTDLGQRLQVHIGSLSSLLLLLLGVEVVFYA